MRTMKLNRLEDSIQLVIKTEADYFEIYYPIKESSKYLKIANAQELIDNAN